VKLLHSIHFLNFDPVETKNMILDKNNKSRYDKETKIAEYTWNYITEEKHEKIEIQKIYLFSIVILGLLKYEDKEDSKQGNNKKMMKSSSSSKIKTQNSVLKEKALILPEFDLNKYNYSPKIYQFIKTNFTLFNENRSNFLLEKKKRQSEQKLESIKEKPTFKPVLIPSKNSKVLFNSYLF